MQTFSKYSLEPPVPRTQGMSISLLAHGDTINGLTQLLYSGTRHLRSTPRAKQAFPCAESTGYVYPMSYSLARHNTDGVSDNSLTYLLYSRTRYLRRTSRTKQALFCAISTSLCLLLFDLFGMLRRRKLAGYFQPIARIHTLVAQTHRVPRKASKAAQSAHRTIWQTHLRWSNGIELEVGCQLHWPPRTVR
jgi:hypothetical protein